ncbi:VOC family protein [Fulvivirga sedimenti]|uniref:VOC domain-containing protein n=1 Tax=Fulvivirga sedimenti TaxID=2879465 RepID=A0A9X1HS25_9BACT|nr:VOC family protein [Fulvivirga sedimenti]MCA6074570.1 hypothetical protein [Fulvivirga sedimenti]MCA6075747.1 hypothetical protein [Fulvivirga sedimenti]MCA6076875.1 hypothetical protein [Fulvivirga sedimenti]
MNGLRTIVYRVPDLQAARKWYSDVFNVSPYFDEPFYIGFNIGGFELGLQPGDGTNLDPTHHVSYWGTDNLEESVESFRKAGATVLENLEDVGGGIRVAVMGDPWGNPVGLIENPHFRLGETEKHPVPAREPGVTGPGGFFFKCKDPEMVKTWYRENLGILTGQYGAQWQWRKESTGNEPGFTVWSAFKDDTDYFEPSQHDFMINYRVNDLEGLLSKMKSNGVQQVGKLEVYDYGKFAWVLDPEGRKIELWEPIDKEYIKIPGETMAAE